MLIRRSASCPGGLCLLSNDHQNTFLNHRPLPKLGRQTDQNGRDVPALKLRVRRFDHLVTQSLQSNNDRKRRSPMPPTNTSLTTTDSTARPKTSSTLGKQQSLARKLKESTKQLVASVPASWQSFYEDSFLSTKSNDITSQQSEQSDVNDSESESGDKDGHGEFPFSGLDWSSVFGSRQGTDDQDSVSKYEHRKLVSTGTCPSQRLESGEETTSLRKIWRKKKEKKRMGSLILLNVLAALYGSSNVADGLVADAAPSLPASLTSLVRISSALVFFAPALMSALKSKDMGLLRAGAELGGLSFVSTVLDSSNPTSGSSSSAALLFSFTVIFVPIMEFCSGRQSGSAFNLTRFATLAAISGMGLLEEEGFGWQGISCPQIGDLWGMAVSIISAVHIFRSEGHGGRFDPLRLNAVQCAVQAVLSLGWETFSTFDATALRPHEVFDQIHCLPWAPLIYNGLICFGLCSWLELHGLRSIHASTATLVYTTIPVWGAFLSFFAHSETPVESAMIGGAVIMVTSVYAQMTTRNVDIDHQINSKRRTSRKTQLAEKQEESLSYDFRPGSDMHVTSKGESTADHEISLEDKSRDYLPGALLTSQLKFPYYAAQAKTLLADVKIKLGALKSILFTTVSSGIMHSTADPPGGPGAGNPTSGTGPAGAPSNVTGSGTNSLTVGNGSSSVTAQIHTLDVSTIHHIAPHGPAVAGSLSSSGPEMISAATHTSESAALVVNTFYSHALAAVTTGLESALIALGSDIMLGFDEAEDVATSLERLLQAGVENAAHTVVAYMSEAAAWLSISYSKEQLNFGGNFILPFPSHITDGVVDAISHKVLPLINHLH